MKDQKIIQLLAFVVFGIVMGKSQTAINVAAGTNITIPMGSKSDYGDNDYALKPGLNISCLIIGRNNPKLNFGMEIVYIENTYQDQSSSGHHFSNISNINNTVSHLNFSFYMSTVPTKKVPLSFFLGPTFGIPISQSITGTATTYFPNDTVTIQYGGKVENSEADLDLRATGKILFEFPIQKKVRFTIDYTLSLGLIQPENAKKIDQKFFYNSLQAGVLFMIDKKEHR